MKFHFLTLLVLGSLFLFQFTHANNMDINKRSTGDDIVLVKRCQGGHGGGGVLDLDCVLNSVVDLLQSILGHDGGHHHHHYNDHETDLVRQLLKLVHKLLGTLDLNGGLDLDIALGGLLGHGHNFDDDDDFGCGCQGDDNALIDHLIDTIEGLLHQLTDCKDGLIPRLVDAVTDLLSGCQKEHQRRRLHDKRDVLVKRCERHDDGGILGLDCLLNSVADLVHSILGGGGHHHHYDHSSVDLVNQLVKLLRKLLGASQHGDLDVDGLLGSLLGGHDHDDDDFGCGCDGNDDALVAHLTKLVEDLLKQLAGCKDGKDDLISQLIEAVSELLKELLGDDDHHHGKHHGGGKQHHGKQHHGGDCGDSLGLDCLLDTVVDLVDSILGGGGHHHVDVKVSHLLNKLVRVVRRLLSALDLDGGLKLDILLGSHGDNDDVDFGCGCDGESLITHLIETVEDILGQLAGCDDDSGLIAQLIKTVRALLDTCHKKRAVNVHKRFTLRKRSTFGKRHEDALDVGLLCGVLDTIKDLLNQILGKCHGDDDLLETVEGLVHKILVGVKNILDCLTKGKLGLLSELVSTLVKQVCELLACFNGRHGGSDGLDDLLDSLVSAVTSLVNGCRLARLIDLDDLVVLHH